MRHGSVRADPLRRMAATVDHFGRILIPKAIRDAAGLRAGTEVEFVADGEGVRLLSPKEGELLREVDGVLVIAGEGVGDGDSSGSPPHNTCGGGNELAAGERSGVHGWSFQSRRSGPGEGRSTEGTKATQGAQRMMLNQN